MRQAEFRRLRRGLEKLTLRTVETSKFPSSATGNSTTNNIKGSSCLMRFFQFITKL